ncbi:hypothetical protein FP74_gp023 [Bacillus phage CAM003]|uniref:Uncharacterized protein n=4 Tax=Bastillevirus TaxID=1918010 RepID=A0A024B193_9CAUD|nr:hypothetical protein FP76_gp024 [Bacillus phage Evoli]YP_009036926.1 hypothetical protein FP74_gp023 [Bacillus phage CAM003]AMW61777.1 hypothetical protein DNAM5_26 [Bacillus phage Vinny]ASU00872.1 hypothetical protein ANTHONY_25 [Bacillus phage Anthony]AHZ09460.1 hypothetical protein [Bacillus phage CAM003]AHZ09748.1 hypothetical protein [Bacillus phage Evoli]
MVVAAVILTLLFAYGVVVVLYQLNNIGQQSVFEVMFTLIVTMVLAVLIIFIITEGI